MGEEDTYGKKVTPLVVAGMELTVAELLKALPGGVQFPDGNVRASVENLDAQQEEKRWRRLKQRDLEDSFDDTVHVLAYLALFSDENLARQMVPPGSKWSTALFQEGFVGPDGQVSVPAPPVFKTIPNTRWNAFLEALDGLPTIYEIKYRDVQRGKRPPL
jgi:hypothetical protein